MQDQQKIRVLADSVFLKQRVSSSGCQHKFIRATFVVGGYRGLHTLLVRPREEIEPTDCTLISSFAP